MYLYRSISILSSNPQDSEFDAAFVLSPCMVHSTDLASISKPLFVLSATFDGICPASMVGLPYYEALVRSPAVFYAELVVSSDIFINLPALLMINV